ncbi:MAG TPA: CRISPR-associated endonuclease Cas2 [Alphaproteobacteria bacterium]
MALSGYRLMWMMVLFDLPVGTKKERRAATKFRNFLLDQGFEMSQFSVYMRFCAGKEQAEVYTKRVEKSVPRTGKVHLLYFTDKQYENIVCFDGRKREPQKKNPEQFMLF